MILDENCLLLSSICLDSPNTTKCYLITLAINREVQISLPVMLCDITGKTLKPSVIIFMLEKFFFSEVMLI